MKRRKVHRRYKSVNKHAVCYARIVARCSGRMRRQNSMPARRKAPKVPRPRTSLLILGSEHVNFEESTEELAPLTEEQVKAKLEELRARAREKKAGLTEQEKIDKKRNDEIKRKATKDQQDIKEDLQKKEQIKEAQAKRREKQDDIEAKKRIQAKIAADKEERRLKSEREKAARAGQPMPVVESAAPAPKPSAPKAAASYTEARLRLQTPNGTIQKTFPVETTLFEVAQAISQESGVQISSFTQNYPKKVFDGQDFGQTLKEAGLVPSAALIAK